MAAGSPTARQRAPTKGVGLNRARVVETATQLVEEVGYEAVSVRRLASDLGVTAPALYDHVASKAELLRAVAEGGYLRLLEGFDVDGDTAIARCRARAVAYVTFAETHPELFRVMFLYRPRAFAIEADNELQAASDAFEVPLADIRLAIAEGDLPDRDPLQLSLTLWASVHGVASLSLMAPAIARHVVDDVIDAGLRGLRPDRDDTH